MRSPRPTQRKYAKRHNLVFVEGNEVLERWEADKHRE